LHAPGDARRWLFVFALSNDQLERVMLAAGPLAPAKRSLFLERVAARLQLHGRNFSDADLDRAMHQALTGLVQNSAA
jgi:hypothetical protein